MKEFLIKSIKFILPYILCIGLGVILTLLLSKKPEEINISDIKKNVVDSIKTAELIKQDSLLNLNKSIYDKKLSELSQKVSFFQNKYSELKKVYENNPNLSGCNDALLVCDSLSSEQGYKIDTLQAKLDTYKRINDKKDSLLTKFAIYTNRLIKTNAGLKLNNDALQSSLKNCDENPNSSAFWRGFGIGSLSTIGAGFGVYFAFK